MLLLLTELLYRYKIIFIFFSEKSCRINVKRLKLNHALIINPYNHSKFLYPDEEGFIFFKKDDPVFLSCGINGNTFKLIPHGAYGTFYCLCDQTFRIRDQSYHFNDLDCEYYIESTVKSNRKVVGQNKYQIGFEVDKSEENFVNLIDVYYEEEFKVTTYVKSEISKFIAGGQDTNVPEPYYSNKCCFPKKKTWLDFINEWVQNESFRIQLPSTLPYVSEDNYVRPGTDYVFIYTFLTPRQSMVYSAAAIATYSKLNIESQWKAVNHNWRCIENHVNEMAKVLKKNLVVYTGGYNILKNADKADGIRRDMYLYAHKEGEIIKREVPLPRYFYKMVIDFTTDSGVVFVTVNNPYKPESERQICTDAYTSVEDFSMPANWEPNNRLRGYSYMCKVDDFLKKTKIFLEGVEPAKINKFLLIRADYTTTPRHELK